MKLSFVGAVLLISVLSTDAQGYSDSQSVSTNYNQQLPDLSFFNQLLSSAASLAQKPLNMIDEYKKAHSSGNSQHSWTAKRNFRVLVKQCPGARVYTWNHNAPFLPVHPILNTFVSATANRNATIKVKGEPEKAENGLHFLPPERAVSFHQK